MMSFLSFGLNSALVGVSLLAMPAIMKPVPETPPSFVKLGSGDAGSPCTATVAAEVLPELKKIGAEKWVEACEAASDTSNKNEEIR